jgi:peroxiredoxin Q/BCP
MLQPGDTAPPFTLPTGDGSTVSLEDYRGSRVVLYFYPRDDTPGCTTQACDFRDQWETIAALGIVVLGVSPDGADSHARFSKKYDLPFSLLADEDHSVAEAYGAWGEKNMYGRKSMGLIRSTFVIDGSGKLEHVFPRVRAKGHVEKLLGVLAG